jgi:hypothetical protein
MRSQMIVAALIGSNLATGAVLVIVSRRAADAQRALAKAAHGIPSHQSPAEIVFIEGNGMSLVQREAMRASAIAARNRAQARMLMAGGQPHALHNQGATSVRIDQPVSTMVPDSTQPTTGALDPIALASESPPPNDTQLVLLLVAFKDAGGGSGEPATLAQQLALVSQAAKLRRDERAVIADSLRGAAAEGTFPALFLVARLHEEASEPVEAARWYLTANIVRIIDSRRFKQLPDEATSREISAMFASVQERLRNNAAVRRAAVAFALDLEEAIKERPPASWLLDKPMLPAAELADLCLTDEQWRAARDAVRASLAASLEPETVPPIPQASAWREQMWGKELPTIAQPSQSSLAAQQEDPQ